MTSIITYQSSLATSFRPTRATTYSKRPTSPVDPDQLNSIEHYCEFIIMLENLFHLEYYKVLKQFQHETIQV